MEYDGTLLLPKEICKYNFGKILVREKGSKISPSSLIDLLDNEVKQIKSDDDLENKQFDDLHSYLHDVMINAGMDPKNKIEIFQAPIDSHITCDSYGAREDDNIIWQTTWLDDDEFRERFEGLVNYDANGKRVKREPRRFW